jgi:hypothetical protein
LKNYHVVLSAGITEAKERLESGGSGSKPPLKCGVVKKMAVAVAGKLDAAVEIY